MNPKFPCSRCGSYVGLCNCHLQIQIERLVREELERQLASRHVPPAASKTYKYQVFYHGTSADYARRNMMAYGHREIEAASHRHAIIAAAQHSEYSSGGVIFSAVGEDPVRAEKALIEYALTSQALMSFEITKCPEWQEPDFTAKTSHRGRYLVRAI